MVKNSIQDLMANIKTASAFALFHPGKDPNAVFVMPESSGQ